MPRSAHYGFSGHETATTITSTSVTYHRTAVFERLPDGSVRLATGGWDTVTTRRRMNQALRHFGLNGSVYRRNNISYVSGVNGCAEVELGLVTVIGPNGVVRHER